MKMQFAIHAQVEQILLLDIIKNYDKSLQV
jgi:hypothetical protein